MSCRGASLSERDPSESSTKAYTDTDTDSTTSEAEDKAINLCDVLKEFMKKHEEEEDELEDGRLPDAIPDTRNLRALQESELQKDVRSTFKTAVANGRLTQALQEVIAEAKEEKEREQAEIEDAMAWRMKLRNTLATAALDGRLATAMESAKTWEEPTQAAPIGALRSKVRQAFTDAAFNGKLARELTEIRQTEKVEAFRLDARNTLVAALKNGSLQKALSSAEDEMEQSHEDKVEAIRAQARGSVLRALTQGKLQDAISQVKQERDMPSAPSTKAASVQELRLKMRNVFTGAAFDGSLESVLSKVSQKPKASTASKPSVDDLRMKLRADLQTFALNGKLSEALQETKRHIQMEELREKARDSFVAGLKDGRLAEVLQEEIGEAPSSLQALRTKVRSAFATAAQNGVLESTLMKEISPAPTKEEKLRLDIKDVLSKAAVNGKLESVLKTIPKESPQAPAEQVRLMMKTTLFNAVTSGSLDAAIAKVKQPQQEQTDATEPKNQTVEDLRSGLRNLFCGGAQNGTLDKALEEVKAEQLRVKARDALRGGLFDGSLRKAVEDTKKDREASQGKSQMDKLREMMRIKFTQAAQDGSLEMVMKKSQEEAAVQELRTKARAVLMSSAMDGKLKDALQDAIEETRAEELRSQARDVLQASALNGQLHTVIQQTCVQRDVVEDARKKLAEAAASGALAEAIKSVADNKMAQQAAAVKMDARQKLLQAAMSGKLSAALQETAVKDKSESLASKLYSGFQKGVQDGSLKTTLGEVCAPARKLEDKLKNTFSRAVDEGNFASALKEAMAESTTSALEDLRKKARMSFFEAEKSGHLSAVLEQVMTPQRPRESEKCPPAPQLPVQQEIAPKAVQVAVANPSKPTIAKGNSRPLRHFPRAAQAPKPAQIEVEGIEESSHPSVREQRPSSCKSSRSRLIFGSVERGAVLEDNEADAGFPTSPTLGRRSMVSAFRMDVEEASLMGGSDEAIDTNPWENAETAQRRVAPGSKMHASGSRTSKKPVMSAMAMDLGEEAPLPSSKSTICARSPRTSQSLGAVRPKPDMQAYSKLPPVFKMKGSCPPMSMKRSRTPVSGKWGKEKSTWTVHLGESAVQWDISQSGVC